MLFQSIFGTRHETSIAPLPGCEEFRAAAHGVAERFTTGSFRDSFSCSRRGLLAANRINLGPNIIFRVQHIEPILRFRIGKCSLNMFVTGDV